MDSYLELMPQWTVQQAFVMAGDGSPTAGEAACTSISTPPRGRAHYPGVQKYTSRNLLRPNLQMSPWRSGLAARKLGQATAIYVEKGEFCYSAIATTRLDDDVALTQKPEQPTAHQLLLHVFGKVHVRARIVRNVAAVPAQGFATKTRFRAAWWRARLRTRMGDRSLCHVDGIVLVGGLRPDSAPVRAPQRRIGPCVPRCVGC